MSRTTMVARAASLPRAPIYGIGRYRVGSDDVDFEVGWPEFDRDIAWAQAQLTATGLTAGDAVLITVRACEGPWAGPLTRALKNLRITYLPAECYAFDSGRSAALLQQFDVKAFVGLGAETLAGWAEKEMSAADLLAGVDIVWARPDAAPKLGDVQAKVAPFLTLGPALAIGRPGESKAAVNSAEWQLTEQDGLLHVTNLAERATRFDRSPTGIRGTVIGGDGAPLFVELVP